MPAPNEEDKLLLDRLDDFLRSAREKYASQFSHFLDERQAAVAQQYLKNLYDRYLFWGGDEACERKMLGIFSEYEEPSPAALPLRATTFTFRKEDALSHRDFLGAILNQMIKRDALGDIFVSEGIAVVFSQEKIAPIISGEITKIGRVGVKAQEGTPLGIPEGRGFEEIRGTVSSMRLDCIVTLLTRMSREKAANLIRSGAVSVMFVPCEEISVEVKPGDKVSIRGFGRFLIDSVGGVSQKGRLHVLCKRFK